MTTKIQKLTEELILIVLISMNLLEFFGLLPGEASFVKAIISLTGIGYVMYKASFSDIFFGEKKSKIDSILLLSYFFMIFNKFIQFSKSSFEEAELLQEFFILLIDNQIILTVFSFIIGTILLFILSLWVVKNLEIRAPSIMHAIHGENIHSKLLKFVSVYLLFISFFIIFFNPIIEWFALVIDAPLVVIVVFFYIFHIHDIGRNKDSEEILYKISESVDTFLEKFIALFHSKKTLFFAISGLLVFHLLADVAAFIIPYGFGTNNVYHESLAENHNHIYNLFQQDKLVVSGVMNHLPIFIGYLINLLGILYLMLYPAYIWYVMYIDKKNKTELDPTKRVKIQVISNFFIALFYGFLIFQLFLPVFSLNSFLVKDGVDMYGVDIQSNSILIHQRDISVFLAMSVAVFIIVFVLSSIPQLKHIFFTVMSLCGVIFLGMYIFNYYRSIALYYTGSISLFMNNLSFSNIYFLFFNILLLLIVTVFYIGGYLSFIIHMFID